MTESMLKNENILERKVSAQIFFGKIMNNYKKQNEK